MACGTNLRQVQRVSALVDHFFHPPFCTTDSPCTLPVKLFVRLLAL